MIRYLDTSAAIKLLVEEAESAALAAFLRDSPPRDRLVASWLLHTELRCAANRRPDDVDIDSVAAMLDSVDLVDLMRGDLLTAGALPGRLRSNDAIHLAVAVRISADEMVTYDGELGAVAGGVGLTVRQPS